MNFFLDNNISPNLGRAIEHIAEADSDNILHILTHYGKDPGDEKWLSEIKSWPGDWVIISGDVKILTNPLKQAIYLSSGRPFYVPPPGFVNKTIWPMAAWFCKCFPLVQAHARKHRGAHAFQIREHGQIEEKRLKK